MMYEVEYKDANGDTKFCEVEGHANAMIIAREYAVKFKRRTTIRRAPTREWRLIVADLKSGTLIELQHKLSQKEAAILWRHWRADREQAALLLWPTWTARRLELKGDDH